MFNQRTNAIARYDFLLEKEPPGQGMPLLRTVAHSNNPSIVRTSKLRDEWLPVCLNDPFYVRRDLRATAYGIEEPLFKMHIQDVHAAGFQKAHDRWGTYLFGHIGDAARIIHLGE
ncbi:MAG: hypothetical protein C4519_07340 [Desulfobacteraceae bacterium]|nr:MAG: hypothetical protein C4519_07340 [Desulfobacteraceae bacterium]